MRKSLVSPVVALVAVLSFALAMFASPVATFAQSTPEGEATSHPAHIHLGVCPEPGDVVFPLNDVVPSVGDTEMTDTGTPGAVDPAIMGTPDPMDSTMMGTPDVIGTPELGTPGAMDSDTTGTSDAIGTPVMGTPDPMHPAGTPDAMDTTDAPDAVGTPVMGTPDPMDPMGTPDAMDTTGVDTMPADTASLDTVVVMESTTIVDASLDEILGVDHAINLHLSAAQLEVFVACGTISGTADDGELTVQLEELNVSGISGHATLVDNGDGTTTVHIEVRHVSVSMEGTPEATPAP